MINMRKKQKQHLDRRTWREATVFILGMALASFIIRMVISGYDIADALSPLIYLLVAGVIMAVRSIFIPEKK